MPPKAEKPAERTSLKYTNSWKDKQLHTFDIYNIYKNRTCDIFFMAECSGQCSIAIEKFKKGGNIDPTNIIKPITYEDIISNVNQFSHNTNSKITYEILYSYLAQEAIPYLNKNQRLPSPLLANLIKIQIAFTISQDVATMQRKVIEARDVENECAALVEQTEVVGKRKDAKSKGGKDAKGADKKKGNKTLEKVYDICDSNNELKFKNTSKLAKIDRNHLVVQDNVDTEQKHLFIVIVGFYDFHVIEELFKNGVKIVGFIELTKPLPKIKRMATQSCICLQCVESDTDFEDDKKSCKSDLSWKPYLVEETPDGSTEKSGMIFNFWRKIYEYLESDNECPEYLNDSFHMTVCLPEYAYEENLINNDKHCLSVFSDIGSEIIKSPDVKRQHINYVRNLKICPVESKPIRVSSSFFKLYNNLMNTIPPDCINVFTIVYALVEEVCKRVPDPPQIILDTPSSTISGSPDKESSTSIDSFLKIDSELYHGIKGQIADILYKNLNIHSYTKDDTTENEKYGYNPKLNLKITNKIFLVQENSELEVMVNSYGRITSKLLDINIEKLVQSTPVLLWKGYPCDETTQQKVLNKMYNLQTIADYFEVPMKELEYTIHLIFFNSLTCRRHNCSDHFYKLQSLFPKKNYVETPMVLKSNIPFKFNIEKFEDTEEDLEIVIPYVQYLNKPNLYEAKNIVACKWYEILPVLSTLQELYQAEKDYLCLDYKYCSFDDSILLRYHNCVDEFGINIAKWDQGLRTAISTVREFCRYIIHVESEWLEKEEQKYIDKCNKKYFDILQEESKLRKTFYPDLIFKDDDFVQRGSIKWKAIQQLKQLEEKLQQVDKKGGKEKIDTKDKGKGGKSETAPPSQIVLLEKLSKPALPPAPNKPSLHCAKENEPFSFYAYDVSNNRVQLTGTTTTFHSQDGFKVSVDQTNFIGKPKNLSINININDNCLILHHNHITELEPFTFHFALSDRTTIVFDKPIEMLPPEERLGERICQTFKKGEDSEKRQDVYFISKKQSSVLRCFNVPYITRKNLILSEDLLVPFLNQLNMRRINIKLKPIEALTSTESILQNNQSKSEVKKIKSVTCAETRERIAEPKYIYDVVSKVIAKPENELEEEVQTPEEEFIRSKRMLSQDSMAVPPLLQRSNRKLLRKIRQAAKLHLPMFKICSSKLHKYQYVKRVKSRIEMQIGTVLKRIPCKPPLFKSKIDLKISKLLPVTPCIPKPKTKADKNNAYNIKICLPSGLLIESVDGIEDFPFHIRQKYLDKGPQCKSIAHEYSRTFLRNGNILIKKYDGNVDILSVAGQKVKCEIPYLTVKSKVSTIDKDKCINRQGNDLIPLHTSSLTKFQKQLNKSIKRLSKHLIDGCESQHLLSYKACQKWKKNYVKDPNQVYILQNSIGNLNKFSLITSDGKKLKITPSIISERKKYYTSTATDYRYQEIYYAREDGTHSLLNHESLLVTQFPDGTRLTTWIEVERDVLLTEEKETIIEENVKHEEQQVNDFDFLDSIELPDGNVLGEETFTKLSSMTHNSESMYSEEEEQTEEESKKSLKFPIDDVSWVSVHLNIKYEHPNYATIIYYGVDNHTEIILPNNIMVKATDTGEYTLNIDQDIYSKITTEQILLESRLCNACRQKDINTFNIKPLYYKSQTNPHETELLKTVDSFKKIFVVNYAGQCFRNTKFIQKRTNIVNCTKHNNYENQKLFVLTRSLVGCRLWDAESYRNCLAKAKRLGTCINQKKSYVELRRLIRKPYHEKFVIPYIEPTIILTKNKPKISSPRELAYVTRQVINELPQLHKFYHVFLVLLELLNTKKFPSAHDFDEFKTFTSYVIDEISGKHIRPEDRKIRKPPPPPPSPKPKKPPFNIRRQKWSKECKEHWSEIRKNIIPKYFTSPYYQEETSKKSNEEAICKCREDENSDSYEFFDASLCECDKISFTSPDGSIIKTIHTVNMHETLNVPSEKHSVSENKRRKSSQRKQRKSRTKSDLVKKQSIKSIPPPPVVEVIPSVDKEQPKRKQTWWNRTYLGKILLNEVKNRIIKIAVEMTSNKSEDVSAEKVNEATKNLFQDLTMAVRRYELHMGKQAYIKNAVDTTVENILKIQLNPVELILLLDNAAREKDFEEINSVCSPLLDPSITGDMTGDKFEACKTTPTKLLQDDSSSYFGVYDHYKDIVKVLKDEKSSTRRVSLKMVYENQHISKTSMQEPDNDVTEDNFTADATCQSPVPCHTVDDSFTFQHYYEKCDQCITQSKPEPKELPSSKHPKFESDTAVNIPNEGGGTKTSVRTGASTVSSDYPSSLSCVQTFSSSIFPTLDVSPESSLLDYCLSENLATVDANTVVLNKNDYKESESKMVLFSVISLKEKELELLEPEPYVQRNPDEAVVAIENIVANTKAMPPKVLKKHIMHEPLKASDRECSKTLLPEQSLHECRKCILRLEDELLNKTDSLSHFKTKSVASLLTSLKRTQSDDNLSSSDKDRITASLLNIIEDLPIKSHLAKHETNKLFSKISDKDAKVAKGLRTRRSQLILKPTRDSRKRVTRKTIGSQTQTNVKDQNN